MSFKSVFLAAAVLAMSAVSANAGQNIVEAPTGFFAPGQAATFDPPYYRNAGQDWGYQHGALADQDTSASGVAVLRISAFDVDFSSGERDAIYAGTDTSGIFLGFLQGADSVYAFTDFVITDPAVLALIQTGLPIWMNIDSLNTGWIVTLGRSVLCSNVRSTQDCVASEIPGEVPEPITLTLFGAGLAGAAAMRRRMVKKA